mgnify:CR=1 FL=1
MLRTSLVMGNSVLIEQALSGRIRLPTEIRKLQKALLGRRMNAIHVPPRVVRCTR